MRQQDNQGALLLTCTKAYWLTVLPQLQDTARVLIRIFFDRDPKSTILCVQMHDHFAKANIGSTLLIYAPYSCLDATWRLGCAIVAKFTWHG